MIDWCPSREVRRLATAASLLALAACDKSEPAPPPPSSAVVIDAIDPEALVEGDLTSHGLKMPVGSKVQGENPVGAAIHVPHPLERVSSYFRARVDAKSVETGPNKTVFLEARRRGATQGEPYLKIIVVRRSFGTDVLFSRAMRPGTPSPLITPSSAEVAPPTPSLEPPDERRPPERPFTQEELDKIIKRK
jgi:hypothetical protein